MVNSLLLVSFPQDIIDYFIGTIDVDDKVLLRTCALVSCSFLRPSRKQLFSSILLNSSERCRALHDLLTRNSYIQLFVKMLQICDHDTGLKRPIFCNEDLLSILQLPLCCLKTFSVSSVFCNDWNELSNSMRNTIWDVVHSPSLTTFTLDYAMNVPIDLFLGLTAVRSLRLDNVYLDILKSENSISQMADLTKITTTFNEVIERFSWSFLGSRSL
jgi:hypothetical protein